MKSIRSLLSHRVFHRVILFFLIFAAIFLRFYNLEATLQFQGDQGRDAMIVADIFREKDLVFIGPVTSVGNMYLGPLYYYFMLPFLWLSYPSPMGPVYAVALLGVATAWLVYVVGKRLIGKKAALMALFFFVFSAVITSHTRFSWNPNPAPLVSILMVYFTHAAWKKHPKYWIWVVASFSVLIQLHYMTLLAAPAAGLIWLIQLREAIKQKKALSTEKKSAKTQKKPVWRLLKPTLIGAAIFILSLTPLVLFDLKHQGSNFTAFQRLLSQEENFKYGAATDVGQKILKTLKENEGRGMHVLFEYMIGKNRELNQVLLYGFLLVTFFSLRRKKKQEKDISAEIVIGTYLLVGILGTALYEHTVFDHYIAYLFPITALTWGYVIAQIRPKAFSSLAFLGLSLYFLSYNLPKLPLQPIGWQVSDIQRTSQAILQRVEPGEKYNIVLLSESRDIDGQNYRYFLTTGHTPPVKLEQRGETETLYIINEEKRLEKVTDSPIYEIVVFPNKEPAEVFEIEGGPEITVLKVTSDD